AVVVGVEEPGGDLVGAGGVDGVADRVVDVHALHLHDVLARAAGDGAVENHPILLLWRHPVLRTRPLPNSWNSAPSVTTSRAEGGDGQAGKGADHGRSGHGAERHLG